MKDEFISAARGFVGAKWRHRGRKPWAMDCIGLVVLSLKSVGIEVNDRFDYSRDPWNDGLRTELLNHFGDPVSGMVPGDIALLKWENSNEPAHVAIITDINGDPGMIHAYSLICVTEHRIDAHWKSLIHEVFSPWRK